jgi:hypothetical protein
MAIFSGPLEYAEIAGRRFEVDAGEDVELMLAGYSNESRPAGSGNMLTKKVAKLGNITLPLVLDPLKQDLEFLQDVANRLDSVPVVAAFVIGTVYQGVGQIEGDLKYASQDGRADVEMMLQNVEQQ